MKKILLLGGSTQQIPAIEYANDQGYYTILCDYLIDNPGQHVAKKFYCVSTTDKEKILNIAIEEKIDGVVAYASDPAAPTAAYVSEKLGLPTNPCKSVEILAYKDKFRNFLEKNNFNCPKANSYLSYESARNDLNYFTFPIMVKPIDSSGSKGVSKVVDEKDFRLAFNTALNNSREKNVIIEEFIEQDHPYMIAGDCFVIDGKVEFWGLLNSHRDTNNSNPYVPIGTSYPVFISEKRLNLVKKQTQKLFDALDIKFGAFNIEIMIDKNDELFFIEMGPRNGGNMIPDLLGMLTGEDLIGATIESALGNKWIFKQNNSSDKYMSTYVLHSKKEGTLKSIKYDKKIEDQILGEYLYKSKGDTVESFKGSNSTIGIIFLEFSSSEEMLYKIYNAEQWVNIEVI